LRFAAYGAGTLTTDALGNVTATSDLRLKKQLGLFELGRAGLRGLKPIRFRWEKWSGNDTENDYFGWSAQNILSHIPQAIGTMNSSNYLTVTDRTILAVVVNAINEIGDKQDSHELRIAELELNVAEQQLEIIELKKKLEATQASSKKTK
jgi:hypothetical protein